MHTYANGLDLYYEQRGTGPDVLLLPGLGASTHVWYAQLRDLSQSFRVTAVDPRGHGRSARPAGPYSIQGFSEDLGELIRVLSLAPAALVASSMSSLIAVEVAARWPGLVSALVLVGGFATLSPEGKERFEQRAVLAETEGMEPLADLVVGAAMGPHTHQTNPGLVGLFRQALLGNDPIAYAASCRAIRDADVTVHLSGVRCPTLILLGEQELVAPITAARALKAGIPHAQVRVLPHAGHVPFLEQPAAFNSAVAEFLAQSG